MQSDVEIANIALDLLGSEPILALTDNSPRARRINRNYASTRDGELGNGRRFWRFAIKRWSLPALAVPATDDYAFAYQVPADLLQLMPGGDLVVYSPLADIVQPPYLPPMWSREGNQILTSLPAPLKIRGIYRVIDPTLFHPCFVQALAARLAWRCCEGATQSDSKRQLAAQEYKQAISEASSANALELPPRTIPDDTWVSARFI